MKRGTRFFVALAATIITYASLTAFVGPHYHAGWRYNNYYRGYHQGGRPYQPYWQQPFYAPAPPDSFYTKPPATQHVY